jgi:hypothetical protein
VYYKLPVESDGDVPEVELAVGAILSVAALIAFYHLRKAVREEMDYAAMPHQARNASSVLCDNKSGSQPNNPIRFSTIINHSPKYLLHAAMIRGLPPPSTPYPAGESVRASVGYNLTNMRFNQYECRRG